MHLKSVFISSYTFIKDGIRTNDSGPVVPMMRFFTERSGSVFLLEQPLPGSDDLRAFLTCYRRGREKKTVMGASFRLGRKTRTFDSNRTYMRLKFRDIVSNFWALLRNYRRFRSNPVNLFVGVECVNAVCGLVFKKLGLVETVAYYVFDWAPDRYPNSLVNKLYIFLDRIATYHSDATWNITYTIGEARKEILGYDERRMSPQIYVPYSPDFSEELIRPDSDVDSDLVVYAGGLIPENGPALLLEAFCLVLERYPKARLLVIGGGQQERELRAFVEDRGVEESVTFTGYIAKESEVLELQSSGAIGVAPYPVAPGSRKPFGDVIKIRMYFKSGLVTVTTPVPPVWREIEQESLGIVTADDSAARIAEAILRLLQDKETLFTLRHNVIDKAKKSTWEATFSFALKEMGIGLDN
ncbi:MAG: glycosyltransferase [Actinomycetota bacterium]|nr:glycosyltransferase [Actinomycetota bacterium]